MLDYCVYSDSHNSNMAGTVRRIKKEMGKMSKYEVYGKVELDVYMHIRSGRIIAGGVKAYPC